MLKALKTDACQINLTLTGARVNADIGRFEMGQ